MSKGEYTQTAIAKIIGCCQRTISKELSFWRRFPHSNISPPVSRFNSFPLSQRDYVT